MGAAEGETQAAAGVVERTEADLSAVLASKDLPAPDLKAIEETLDNIVDKIYIEM